VRDAQVIEQLAGSRPIVRLSHARQRPGGEPGGEPGGKIGVLWRGEAAVAIYAHRCELVSLPEAIGALAGLERLDVGDNQLTELPALPASLRELYVHDNQLARLPELPALDVLDANRNRLAEVPAIRGIGFVYLAGNRLAAPPATSGVRYLNIGDNPLEELRVADPAIEELRAEHAQVRGLAIDGLTGLRELSLRGNRLAALPASIGALARLRTLDLRGNQLDELPDALRALPLTKLDLRWNPLGARPGWLDELARRGCLVYV
jgi:Leucine-rich repeat (LRR) protein